MLPAQSSRFLQSTTQQYLEIYDVTNDLIILKDGSVAMVLQTNAMNFGLLSEEEQDATIYTYAGLLNSLTFPIEIVIRSQKKDVTTYLNYLKAQEQNLSQPVRKTQLRRYREFVEALVQETNILDKKFYIVIPYSAVEMGIAETSPIPGVPAKKRNENKPLDKLYILDKAKTNLEPKRDHLLSQLARIGLIGKQMKTQDLIQLLYTIYNPEAANDQHMTDSNAYTMPVVEASIKTMASQPSLQSFSREGMKDTTTPQLSTTPTTPPTQDTAPQPVEIKPQTTIQQEPISMKKEIVVENPTMTQLPSSQPQPPTEKDSTITPQPQVIAPNPIPAQSPKQSEQPIQNVVPVEIFNSSQEDKQ